MSRSKRGTILEGFVFPLPSFRDPLCLFVGNRGLSVVVFFSARQLEQQDSDFKGFLPGSLWLTKTLPVRLRNLKAVEFLSHFLFSRPKKLTNYTRNLSFLHPKLRPHAPPPLCAHQFGPASNPISIDSASLLLFLLLQLPALTARDICDPSKSVPPFLQVRHLLPRSHVPRRKGWANGRRRRRRRRLQAKIGALGAE